MKTINKKSVKITRAGYLYIDGKRATERKINPFYTADEFGPEIGKYCQQWAYRNYVMCEPR